MVVLLPYAFIKGRGYKFPNPRTKMYGSVASSRYDGCICFCFLMEAPRGGTVVAAVDGLSGRLVDSLVSII